VLVTHSKQIDFTRYPDSHGHFGPYGGQFVAETLMLPIQELNEAYHRYMKDPDFLAELDYDLKHYVGRPSPLYHAERLSREWGGAQNVRMAIQELEAERIGHGVRVLEDPEVVMLARERYIPFEVCITSNYQSGALAANQPHPLLKMIEAGLRVTINSDDPSVSQIDLSHEYRYAMDKLGLSVTKLRELVLAAAQSAFLLPDERDKLVARIAAEFPTTVPVVS